MKKSIFITGAAGGIGRATAQLFIKKGWFVGLADLNEKKLQVLNRKLGAENCSIHLTDITKINQVQKALTEFSKKTGGKINVLFNNAGILYSGGFEKLSLEKHKAVTDINITGQMNVTYTALPVMKATPASVIINMCSVSSLYGNPDLTAYAASKSALKSLTESWNLLFKKYDIHVTDINPSYVKTEMLKGKEDTISVKDIKLSPERIAESVWKATNSKKIHHYVGFDAKLFKIAKRALPESVLIRILKNSFYKKALRKN